ncbi:MAG: hypothetical protein JRJ08_05865 [Deltaproteobacteria bacterium]|nr:hypothetical protein [Deltaproteobacteria bacterium]
MNDHDDKETRLEELKTILIKEGLLDNDEELIAEMMEDLAHFAYFTGCITKSDVKRLLSLTDEEAKSKIKSWKLWNEGNRSCGLTGNPFSEGWNLVKKP